MSLYKFLGLVLLIPKLGLNIPAVPMAGTVGDGVFRVKVGTTEGFLAKYSTVAFKKSTGNPPFLLDWVSRPGAQ